MKSILTILVLYLSCISCKTLNAQDLVFEIKNQLIKNKDTVVFIVKNKSNQNYCLPLMVNLNGEKYINNVDDYYSFYPKIILTDKNKIEIIPVESNSRIIDEIENFNYQKYFDNERNKFIKEINFNNLVKIKKKSQIELKFVFAKYKRFNNFYQSEIFYVIDQGEYSLQMKYSPNEIYKNLPPNLLKEVEQNNYILFKGTINSNKIPVLIEKSENQVLYKE